MITPNKWHACMMTCEREEPTVQTTIDSLMQVYNGGFDLVEDKERKGAFQNYDKCLRMAYDSGAEFILVSSDDFIFYDFQHQCEQHLIDGVGYIALWTPIGVAERYKFQLGWNEVVGGWATSWGGQYVFKREVLKHILEHPFYIAHLNGTLDGSKLFNYHPKKRIDHVIPEVVHQLGLKQLYHAPSFVQHIGYTSTLGHEHTRLENGYLLPEYKRGEN
jgi:hypothetical protein